MATDRPLGASGSGGSCVVRANGQRLKQVDAGSSDICLFSPVSFASNMIVTLKKSYECSELRDQSCGSSLSTVYIRASSRSFHGQIKPKRIRTAEHRAPSEGEGVSGTNTNRNTYSQHDRLAADDEQRNGNEPGEYSHSQRERPESSALPTLNPIAETVQPHRRGQLGAIIRNEDHPSQASTSAPLPSRPRVPVALDDSLIKSDIYGQSIHPHGLRGQSILDDLANYGFLDELDDNEF